MRGKLTLAPALPSTVPRIGAIRPRPVPHRPRPAGFEGVTPSQLTLRCLRKKQYMSDAVLGAAIEWFNALCVDDADLPVFREWQRWREEMEKAAAAEAAGSEDAEPGSGDVAAAAAAATHLEQQTAQAQEPEDFWQLQAEFYKAAPKEAGSGEVGRVDNGRDPKRPGETGAGSAAES